MSVTTDKLEVAVAEVIANRAAAGARQTPRQRVQHDRAFMSVLKLIAPRIRHFIRQYGLADHWEDAEQVCAIAVHSAIAAYDPDKARFTTFINWQIRGELQALRFRLMTDQRPSAKRVDAVTISLDATIGGEDGDMSSMADLIEDESALDMVEGGAATYLADAASNALIDAYIAAERAAGIRQLRKRARPAAHLRPDRPDLPKAFRAGPVAIEATELDRLEARLQRDRTIVERALIAEDSQYLLSADTGLTRERVRQITRHATHVMGELIATDPRFRLLADRLPPRASVDQLRAAIAEALPHSKGQQAPATLPHSRPAAPRYTEAPQRRAA